MILYIPCVRTKLQIFLPAFLLLLVACNTAQDKEVSSEHKETEKRTSPPTSEELVQRWSVIKGQDSIRLAPKMGTKEDEEPLLFGEEIYTDEQWRKVKNPLVATYTGNFIGDYFHLGFTDANGNMYDFGNGNNSFHGKNEEEYYQLYDTEKDFTDHLAFLNKEFTIHWEWKLSKFPCCEGEYDIVEEKRPSIVRLYPSKKQEKQNQEAREKYRTLLETEFENLPSSFQGKFLIYQGDSGILRVGFTTKDGSFYNFLSGMNSSPINGYQLLTEGRTEPEPNYEFDERKFQVEWEWQEHEFLHTMKESGITYQFTMSVPTITHLTLLQ